MLTIEFYETGNLTMETEWRWRAIAKNGKIVADGGEGYTTKAAARKGFNVLKNGLMAEDGYETKETPLVLESTITEEEPTDG